MNEGRNMEKRKVHRREGQVRKGRREKIDGLAAYKEHAQDNMILCNPL